MVVKIKSSDYNDQLKQERKKKEQDNKTRLFSRRVGKNRDFTISALSLSLSLFLVFDFSTYALSHVSHFLPTVYMHYLCAVYETHNH